MKTNCTKTSRGLVLLAALLALAGRFPAQAVLPEPDNVIYGTISRDGLPVTAADYDVVVEIRRALTGPVLASYQMGSNPRFGHYYSVRVPLESVTPKLDEGATETGDRILLVVTDQNGDFATTNLVVSQRGVFQRIDLGPPLPSDADGDGLPDDWELVQFGNLGNNGSSVGANGMTALQNYIAGTNPNDPNGAFKLFIVPNSGQHVVSFLAIRAEGVGYQGKSRYYTLESTPAFGSNYVAVTGFTNILGNNQTVLHPSLFRPPTNRLFRANVTLRGP